MSAKNRNIIISPCLYGFLDPFQPRSSPKQSVRFQYDQLRRLRLKSSFQHMIGFLDLLS